MSLPPLPVPKGVVRFSHLKAYGRSALHGHHARTAEEDDPTVPMERGTALHAIVFGTKKVCGYPGPVRRDAIVFGTKKVCGYPGPVRRGKEYEKFVLDHPDHEILTSAEFDKARRMADAVMAHKLAWPLLQGVREETLLFKWNGMECRSTPDVRGPEFITELKSAPSADPERFPWHSRRMHYHVQMRFESIAVKTKFRAWPQDCYVVVVEHEAPHAVQVFRVEERALEIADRQLMLWSERLKVAEGSGVFPPYTTVVAPLDLPQEDEDDIELVFPADDPNVIDPEQLKYGIQA